MNINPYVRITAAMAQGLAKHSQQYGVKQSWFEMSEPAARAGACFGLGTALFGRANNKLAEPLFIQLNDESKTVRKSAVLSVGLAFTGTGDMAANHAIQDALECTSSEAKKNALLSLGLINAGTGWLPEQTYSFLNSSRWDLRASAGLALSFAYMGLGNKLFDRMIHYLQREKNGYVRVCTSWFISLALAGQGETAIQSYLKLLDQDDIYFRDMACLGIGFSGIGSGSQKAFEVLNKKFGDDHEYVRESACLGLGIATMGLNKKKFLCALIPMMRDCSSVVRTGAAIGLGLCAFNHRTRINCSKSDSNLIWALQIANGLAGVPSPNESYENDFRGWGRVLHCVYSGKETGMLLGSDDFGLFGTALAECASANFGKDNTTAARLFIPGFFLYGMFESFWWGLWTISMSGLWNLLRGDPARRFK